MTTIIVLLVAAAFIGGFIYLKKSADKSVENELTFTEKLEQAKAALEEASNIQKAAQAEVEKSTPKQKAPRKKKETTNEGPIRTKSSKKAVK